MEEYIGVIKLFAGKFVPLYYMECNGQLLSITSNEALYSILMNEYGGDLHSNNFALPKLTSTDERMRYIICVNGIYPTRD